MLAPRVAIAALALLLTTPAFAQVTTADIIGRVTDASGAVLPGVTVTAENLGTHETRVAPTGGSGDYAFTLLPIGRYKVTIELQGFTTQTANLALAAGDRSRLDIKLQVGAVSKIVTVVAESPLVSRRFRQFQSASAVGTIAFTTALTDNGAGAGGNSIASFLLGYPSTSPTRRASPTRSRSSARRASGRSTASATRSRGRCSSR